MCAQHICRADVLLHADSAESATIVERDALVYNGCIQLLNAGLCCLCAQQKNKKFQRDFCCVSATHWFVSTLCRLVYFMPIFGTAITMRGALLELVVNAPAFWFLFEGFGKAPAAKGEPADTWTRKIYLWQATVMVVYGVLMFGWTQTLLDFYRGNKVILSPSEAAVWGLSGELQAVITAGLMCILSGSASHKTRRHLTMVGAGFAVLFVCVYRLGFQGGFLFPDHLAALMERGWPESAAVDNLLMDIVVLCPLVAAFVLEMTGDHDKSD